MMKTVSEVARELNSITPSRRHPVLGSGHILANKRSQINVSHKEQTKDKLNNFVKQDAIGVVLDFKKAFDTIEYNVLLRKSKIMTSGGHDID